MPLNEPPGFIMQSTSDSAPFPFDNFLAIWKNPNCIILQKNNTKYNTFYPVNMQNKSLFATAPLFSKSETQLKDLYHSIL